MTRRRGIPVLLFRGTLRCRMSMTLGLLQRAIVLPFEDWSYLHVWVYLPVFYFGGIAIASRRYQ